MTPLCLSNRQGGTPFDWSVARALAERCALAYTETPRSLVDKNIPGQFITNSNTDTEALVIQEPQAITVAFRGSQNLKDWLQDFKVAKQHPRSDLIVEEVGDVVQVHTGFMQDVDSITEALLPAIRSLLQPCPVFVTGHSKGAAEATLFALELQRQKFNVAGVYLFGCPRVGDSIFRNVYNSTLYEETFRVVNENDIVPRVPGVLMGYRHVGQEIFLPVGGGFSLNPSLWVKMLSDAIGLWGAWRHEQDVLVSDHNIAAYQRRISLL